MSKTATAHPRPIQYASDGRGPLLRRDYWAAIDGAAVGPEDLARLVRERFCRCAPPETAEFHPARGDGAPLGLDDELSIRISLVGRCAVRLTHLDARSLTLRTLRGHPEAGRITFGATRDDQGRLIFRIRSITRASNLMNYLGFLAMGKQMQGRTWIKFVEAVASECGGHIPEAIHVEGPVEVEEQPADRGEVEAPTFATGAEEASTP